MSNAVIISLAVLGFLFLFFTISVITSLIFHNLKNSRICRLKTDGILSDNFLYLDEKAIFFGIKTSGFRTLRGNGIFIITEKQIYFSLFLPDKEYKIKIDSIEEIRTGKSFLGKTKFRELLIIDFKENDARLNSAAWLLSDLNQAIETLEKILKR